MNITVQLPCGGSMTLHDEEELTAFCRVMRLVVEETAVETEARPMVRASTSRGSLPSLSKPKLR